MVRKATAKATDAGAGPQRLKLIDEYVALDREVSDFKPKLLRYEKLRSLLLEWQVNLPPEGEATIVGSTCDIIVSARDQVRTVTPEGKVKLYKLWGTRGFIAKSMMLLKSLPDPADEKGLYTTKTRTGPRHLHVVSRVRAAAPAA